MRRTLTLCGFCFLLSGIICLNSGINVSAAIAVICVPVFVLLIFLRRKLKGLHLYVIVICIFLSSLNCCAGIYYKRLPCEQLDNTDAHITARLVENPKVADGYTEYIFETETVNGTEMSRKFRTRVSESINAQPYDYIDADVHFSFNKSGKNYDWADNVFLSASINKCTVSQNTDKPLRSYILRFRELIEQSIYENTDADTAMMVNAVVMNNKNGLSQTVKNDFRALGLSHTMAVSGMHISLIATALFSLLTLLYVSLRKRCVVCIAAVLLYLCCVGFIYSAVRAGIMLIIILVGKMIFRNADALNSLGFATLILLIINPYIAVNTSFLLSFSATFGMIILMSPLMKATAKVIKGTSLPAKVARALIMPVAQSFCAQLFTLPVCFATVGEISVIAPISNLICIPLVTLTIWSGLIYIISLPIPYVNIFFGDICNIPVYLLLKVTRFLADKVAAPIDIDQKYIGLCIAGCLIFFAVGLFLTAVLKLNLKRIVIVCSVCCAVCFTVTSAFSVVFLSGISTITAYDCDNGVCVAVESQNRTIIIGLPEKSEYVLNNYTNYNGNCVDLIIIPDYSKDYYKGTAGVARSINATKVYAKSAEDSYYELPNTEDITKLDECYNDNIKFEVKTGTIKMFLGNTSVLFITKSSNISAFGKDYLKSDIAVIPSDTPENLNKIDAQACILCADNSKSMKLLPLASTVAENVYPIANAGNIQIQTRGQKDLNIKRIR